MYQLQVAERTKKITPSKISSTSHDAGLWSLLVVVVVVTVTLVQLNPDILLEKVRATIFHNCVREARGVIIDHQDFEVNLFFAFLCVSL